MKFAEKYGMPVVTFIDTPGAYPGIGAEERGQAQAIAMNLMEMSRLRVPIICIVIGEGGSGGALGHRRRRQNGDARVCVLLGNFARRLRGDFVARRLAGR